MVKNIDKLFSKTIIFLIIILSFLFIQKELEKKYNNQTNTNNSVMEIYYFNVGQADSTLIKCNNYSMLIDAGNVLDGDNLSDYLKNDIKIDNINIVVGTHPHEDHIGGLYSIINNLTVDKIYMPNVISTSKPFNDVLNIIKDKNLSISIPKINDTFNLGDMKFKVIYVDDNEDNLNDSSIVLRLDYYNTSFLFMGDASKSVEKKILDSDIDVDVIKIGHHGSNYSSSQSFINKVSPKYAIIEVGENNYKHPSSEVLKMLEKKDIEVLRTDEYGTIKLVTDGKKIDFEFLDTNLDG